MRARRNQRKDMNMSNVGQSALNNFLQKRGRLADLSWIDTTEGPTHKPEWKCFCKIQGVVRGTGTGDRKYIARDIAADAALAFLKHEEEED